MWDLQKVTTLAGKGKVNRREFIQFALAAGVGLAAAETMYVDAVASTPKQGGSPKFGLAHGATTDTLDPAGYPDTATQVPFWGAMSNSLTEVDANGNITADLAESRARGEPPARVGHQFLESGGVGRRLARHR